MDIPRYAAPALKTAWRLWASSQAASTSSLHLAKSDRIPWTRLKARGMGVPSGRTIQCSARRSLRGGSPTQTTAWASHDRSQSAVFSAEVM